MAEDSGPLQSLGKVIPSIYYDLIARVCAGVPFLSVIIWDRKDLLGEISWAKLALFLGAGYVAGLVLTTLTVILFPVEWLISLALGLPTNSWQRNDEISQMDKDAGATLAKMAAEATLCQNLFCAFLFLVLLNRTLKLPIPALDTLEPVYMWFILLLLAGAAAFRTVVYLGRQNCLYEIHILNSEPSSGNSARKDKAGVE